MTDEHNQEKSGACDTHTPLPSGQDLGMAGSIAKAFINSPVTPMLLVATLHTQVQLWPISSLLEHSILVLLE